MIKLVKMLKVGSREWDFVDTEMKLWLSWGLTCLTSRVQLLGKMSVQLVFTTYEVLSGLSLLN